jgi:hypothetical protein
MHLRFEFDYKFEKHVFKPKYHFINLWVHHVKINVFFEAKFCHFSRKKLYFKILMQIQLVLLNYLLKFHQNFDPKKMGKKKLTKMRLVLP